MTEPLLDAGKNIVSGVNAKKTEYMLSVFIARLHDTIII